MQSSTRAFRCLFGFAFAIVSLVLPQPSLAQFGVSSASLSMGRAGLVPNPDAILVEEYFNFHRHNIAQPKDGEAIGFDVRWGSKSVSQEQMAVLQVGLSTRPIPEKCKVPPLNIALVIDRSGSMSGDRIANVRTALLAFVDKLRKTDTISIVGFNTEADLFLEAQEVADLGQIRSVIESINAGGSTNIHAGLMLGYQQVKRHFDPEKTNRVILLTDGRTNTGIKDPEEIIRQSVEFNKQGIDLSTIGLGHDLNHQLLRQLAKSGRGLIHFVDNAKDIQEIFVDELESLLSPVARQVEVVIEHGDGLKFERLFGYEPRFGKGKITLPLDDLNHGSTQVVLACFRVTDDVKTGTKLPVKVRLSYRPIADEKSVVVKRSSKLRVDDECSEAIADVEVRKNYSIARLADSIRTMAVSYQDKQTDVARKVLADALAEADKRHPKCSDKDILRVRKIAMNYCKVLTPNVPVE